jgi:hypothetical protein
MECASAFRYSRYEILNATEDYFFAADVKTGGRDEARVGEWTGGREGS